MPSRTPNSSVLMEDGECLYGLSVNFKSYLRMRVPSRTPNVLFFTEDGEWLHWLSANFKSSRRMESVFTDSQ